MTVIMNPNTIFIDSEKCIACAKCVDVCHSKAIEMKESKVVQSNPQNCLSCGHCGAICSQNAITSTDNHRREFRITNLRTQSSEIEKLLHTKRSIREFKSEEIDKELLAKFVQYAEMAPSSTNQRNREYIIVTDKKKIMELENTVVQKFYSHRFLVSPFVSNLLGIFSRKAGRKLANFRMKLAKMSHSADSGEFPIFRNAPAVVFILAPRRGVQTKDDCIIAQQYMMLYAESQGIGSCIIGYAQYARKTVEKVLGAKKGTKVFAVSIFGYPIHKYSKGVQYINGPDVKWI